MRPFSLPNIPLAKQILPTRGQNRFVFLFPLFRLFKILKYEGKVKQEQTNKKQKQRQRKKQLTNIIPP